jgi:hypothetical protein
MQSAVMQAESATFQLINQNIDDHEFRQKYPNILSVLAKLDVSPEHELLLPPDVYPTGNQIIRDFEKLKYNAIELRGKSEYPLHSPEITVIDARLKCAEEAKNLRGKIEAFHERLSTVYRQTFE